ncbi:hypothetical protein [Amycolatopsis echigonensis]|uniref:hypothetical protein n=1 Tax=Amycolatopsis echigonensis TaxID=2576905 RepID=UPI0011788C1A|nr:hypothetical protein [Amycolatopsis niigatensis]
MREALLSFEPDRFTSHFVLDRVPWFWPDRSSYVEWKCELAAGLDVDPYAIVVVGSACTGVTLNPNKELFREFTPKSDIDVAIVSSYHFELAWKTLREMGSRGHIPTASERRARKKHRSYLVFDGTIATDWILRDLPFGKAWQAAFDAAELKLPMSGSHEVKGRIYRDLQDLRAYQVNNIERLKKDLSIPGDDIDEGEGEPLPVSD